MRGYLELPDKEPRRYKISLTKIQELPQAENCENSSACRKHKIVKAGESNDPSAFIQLLDLSYCAGLFFKYIIQAIITSKSEEYLFMLLRAL